MGKKSPTPPPAPDPKVAIDAQADANRYDSYTPFGNTTWTQEGDRWRQDYNFSPEAQNLFDRSISMLDRDYSGGGSGFDGQGGGYGGGANGDTTFNVGSSTNPQDPQNPNYGSIYDNYGNAVNERSSYLVNRGFDKPLEQFQSEMANRGIPEGSEAYGDLYRTRIGDPMSQALDSSAFKSIAAGEGMRVQDYNMMSNLWGRGQVAPAIPIDVQGPYNSYQSGLNNNYAQQMQRQNAGYAAAGKVGASAVGKK